MRCRPPSSSTRALPRGRAAAWIAGALLAGALPAAAADLTGRAELTYGEDEALASSSDYLRQLYTLSYRRQVTPPTSYQLTLRYRDDRGAFRAGDQDDDLRRRLFEPSAAIEHRMDGFGIVLAYRRNEEATLDPEVDRFVHRSIERYSGSVYVRPFERGELTLAADRLAFDATSVDSLDQRIGITFRYTSEVLRLVNEFRVQRADDFVAQHSRVSIGPRLTAAYSQRLGARSALSAQYVLDYFLTQQDALASAPVTVGVEVQPAAGLFAHDDLPIDTDPMVGEPRLIDRALDQSAGVSLGPDGPSFSNLGLDMGRFVTLDELRVHVRDAAGAPVALGGSVTWSAYSSQDGLRWAQVDGALAAFSVPLSAYVVRFPPTAARFFKVVNFGVNTIESFVTELQPFVQETIQPRTTKTSSSVRQGVSLSLLATPLEKVLLDVTGLLNADVVSPDVGPRRWFTDATTAAGAKFGPFGDFLYGARQTFTIARDPGGLTQSAWTTTGSVRFQPIERYDTTLEARIGGQRYEQALSPLTASTTNAGASLSNRLDVYDSLRLALGAGVSRQEFTGGATTDYLTGSGQVHADLRRDLWLRLQSSVQRTISRRGVVSAAQAANPFVRIVSYELHSAEARYQPTAQLGLAARVGYASAEAGEGVIQSYQASWSPFPGGAVQLAFDYSRDVDPLTGRAFRRIGAVPRWQINRHAQLQLSYNNARGTGDIPVRQQNVFLTFSIML